MKRYCCDHLCEQGRFCPEFMPAESSTDIGAEPDEPMMDYWMQRMLDFCAGMGALAMIFLLGYWLAK